MKSLNTKLHIKQLERIIDHFKNPIYDFVEEILLSIYIDYFCII